MDVAEERNGGSSGSVIRPQRGGQEALLASSADIAIGGGAAGTGKSFALVVEPLRHVGNPKFRAMIFRRSYPQIMNPGGLWEKAVQIYPGLGGSPRFGALDWKFPSGASIGFGHLDNLASALNYQGAEIPLMEFDEVTQVQEAAFWMLLAWNRSTSGVAAYVRATCNPDPDSWVARLIDWWIGEDGLPIADRSGVLRWMLRAGDEIHWYATKSEAQEARPSLGLPSEAEPKSVTFIPGRLSENLALLRLDPGYLSNLYALPLVERERLLGGNWKIRAAAGLVFRRDWFETVDASPSIARRVRFWDLAATEPSVGNPDPDWTVGVRLAMAPGPMFYVEDVIRMRASSGKVEAAIKATATQEPTVEIGFPRDPAQAGKWQAEHLVRMLAGRTVRSYPITGDKLTLAGPVSAQAEAGNLKLVRGAWNVEFRRVLEAFDGTGKQHDDDVDALSGGFNVLCGDSYDLDALTRA